MTLDKTLTKGIACSTINGSNTAANAATSTTSTTTSDNKTRLRTLKLAAVFLAIVSVVLLVALSLPPSIQDMTHGKSRDVCPEQQEALAAYESLSYQGRALSWLNLALQRAWSPYTADQLGMTQQSTTRFRDANGKTLFYLTTSNDWGGLLGVTDADGNRTYVYCLR